MKRYNTSTPKETETVGAELAKQLKAGDFVALFGDLGAGKTAFVRGLASVISPDSLVQSPTFTILIEYPGKIPLFHFDMYRIDGYEDLYNIGFFDYIESNGITVVEWSENITFALPEHYKKVTINKIDSDRREIVIEEI